MTPAILQAILGGVKCPRMARAWRNRSPVTQCDWARRCRELFCGGETLGEISLGELHAKAACVYAACGWYCYRAGTDTFDGTMVMARGWELIATLAEDFLIMPPDQALGRYAWELRHAKCNS